MADIVSSTIRTLNTQQIASLTEQAVQQRAQRQARSVANNAERIDQRLNYRVPASNVPDPTEPRQPAYQRGTPPAQQDGGTSAAQLQRLEDQRYDQQLGRRVDARRETQADITLQQDRQLDAALAAEARTRNALDEARALDAQQLQRDLQLEADRRALEQRRQDAIDAARQSGEPVPRGQVLDVVA